MAGPSTLGIFSALSPNTAPSARKPGVFRHITGLFKQEKKEKPVLKIESYPYSSSHSDSPEPTSSVAVNLDPDYVLSSRWVHYSDSEGSHRSSLDIRPPSGLGAFRDHESSPKMHPESSSESIDFASDQATMSVSSEDAVGKPSQDSPPPAYEDLAPLQARPHVPMSQTVPDSQEYIDHLSNVLLSLHPSGPFYTQEFQRLRRSCRDSGLVPTSSKIPKEIVLLDPSPVSSSYFSDIYRGRLDGQDVAVKVLRLHMDEIEKVKKAYLHELVLWQCLRHQNIVPFLGTSSAFQVSLVSQWMGGATISAYLLSRPTGNRINYVHDVIRGLTYMHSLDVVHGDLKSTNVLVDDIGCARLTDFGLATALQATRATATRSGGGSLRWMAPELLDPDKYDISEPDAGRPTKQSDVYALAITAWEIFSDELPFPNARDAKVIMSVLNGSRPPRCAVLTEPRGLSDDMWASMLRWWDAIPSNRPSLSMYKLSDVGARFGSIDYVRTS